MKDNSQQDDTTSHNEDTLNELIEAARAITRPAIAAKRKQMNGHEVDMLAAESETRRLFADFISQIAPARSQQGRETYSPVDLMETYWAQTTIKKDAAPTGIASLDKALSGGFEPDRLTVLLGAPGSGKTTFTNQIANHIADSGRAVLYVTSEDMPLALLAKTIARRGKIDYSAVQKGYPTHKVQINESFEDYRQQKSATLLRYLDATGGTTLDTIAEQAEAHFNACKDRASGPGLIVVDYLQRLARREGLGTDLRSSITVYTERLREIACDLHCTVIVLCAMNRASGYHAGNSTIASAKESGDIDYTADIIMAIGEQEGATDPAPGIRRWMLRLDKNRQGSVTYDLNHIYLDWYASRQQFTEAQKDEEIIEGIDEAYGSRSNGNGRRGRRSN